MCTLGNAWDFPCTVLCFTPKIRCPVSPKELSFLGFCTDGGCFAFSKRCSPDLGFSPLPGARQKEGGGFLFSNPGRNSSECQGFFTCSVDSTRSANYMTSMRIGNLDSSRQLILPEACIEMPGIVSSASENCTGGGAVTDGMCTQTVSVYKNTDTHTFSCPVCAGILVNVFINIEIAISFIQHP